MDTNTKGKITELKVLTYVVEKGYSVSVPYGDKDRYDQIWDINGNLYKVQIKSSCWLDEEKKEAFKFKTSTCYARHNGYRTNAYNEKEIDYFATFFNNQLYVVPIQECGTNMKILRLKSNGPSQPSINWAKDYTFERIIEKE